MSKNLVCACKGVLVYAVHSLYDKYYPSKDLFTKAFLGKIVCDRNPKCSQKFQHMRCSSCSRLYHERQTVYEVTFSQGKQYVRERTL